MLVALNTKDAYSEQHKGKYYGIPHYKIGDLVMIRNYNKNQTGT